MGNYGNVNKGLYYKDKSCLNYPVVAIKTIQRLQLKEKEFKDLSEEIKRIASINHSSFLKQFGMIVSFTNTVRIVTEWPEGISLFQMCSSNYWIETNSLGLLDIAKQISNGMLALHLQNILHRNLKSTNVYLYRLKKDSDNFEWLLTIAS